MPRRLPFLLAAGVLAAALARLPVVAQTPPPASPPADNTTVVPRVLKLGGQGQVTVSVSLTDGSQPILQGLVWRVFRDKAAAGGGGKSLLVSTHKEASPTLRLDPGTYWINVALGRANLTRKITVVADRVDKAHFVLNAGGLRIVPVLANGEGANLKLVAFDVESDERDEHGQRTKVVIGAKAGVVLRLNAGVYSILSTYGDANATARADVWVEAGRLSEVKVVHPAAEVRFKLVTRGGGDAIADTQWSVALRQGEMVKESSGALPTHFLAPGTYTVSARHAGRLYRRDFTVKAGESRLVEVVMP